MDRFLKLWAEEPVVIIGVLEGAVILAGGFGLQLDGGVLAGISGFVLAVGIFLQRMSVVPQSKVTRWYLEAEQAFLECQDDVAVDAANTEVPLP
jgi:hypothetical protein